ncbi:MAG: SET domain-containing protein [Thermoplasmata archaeon]
MVRPLRTKYSFINHSRTPNLEIDFATMEVKALRNIAKGEELTLDYRKECLSQEYWQKHGCSYL